MKLRGLSFNFHIRVSVSDLFIPTIGPPIFHHIHLWEIYFGWSTYIFCCSKIGGPILEIVHRYMNIGIGTRPSSFISGIIFFEFSVQCLCCAIYEIFLMVRVVSGQLPFLFLFPDFSPRYETLVWNPANPDLCLSIPPFISRYLPTLVLCLSTSQ
jgi:hypothetical protein